jgi:hypothetical protein
MAPEQISARVADPTRAGLIDYWGRVHLLDPEASIGRDLAGFTGIAIHEPSVSRHHGRLTREGESWVVRDRKSSNGTWIEDARVDTGTLQSRDRIRFGAVAFFFLDHVDHIPHGAVDSDTVRPGPSMTQPIMTRIPFLRPAVVEVHEPTGGGGGIVQIDGKPVQLTLAQLELVTLLIARMEADTDKDPDLRGFVSVSELLGKISLEASLPRDAHVRQLIRRVRRLFMKADLGDLIESRYGLGYRILVIARR